MIVHIHEYVWQPLAPLAEDSSVPIIDQIPRNVARNFSRSLASRALHAVRRDRMDHKEDIARVEVPVVDITARDDQKSFDDAALYLAMIS